MVLGAYGNFGTRICRALAGDRGIQLLLGGRDVHRAQALAGQLGAGAQGVMVDHSSAGLASQLRKLGVDLLIHTAGPFQQQSYAVAQAALEAQAHYIDLADGRRFVCDFASVLNAPFRAAGRSAITGASTVPGLSSAVVQALCAGWQRIDVINTCIAPAQGAPRGIATLAAVLGYCGQPIEVWQQGQWQTAYGWSRPERVHFAGLRSRLGALCDIPDLELFPAHYGVSERVMFRAALEVGLTQWAFAALAALRRLGVLHHPERLAPWLHRMAPMLDFLGSSLGGMVVQVQGINGAGQAQKRAWHIAADNDHGPEIPCMPAILLTRKLARGQPLPVGAQPCVGLLQLHEFEPEFARWGMVTHFADK